MNLQNINKNMHQYTFLQLVYLSPSRLCFDCLGLVPENAMSGTRVLISRFGEHKIDLTKCFFSS